MSVKINGQEVTVEQAIKMIDEDKMKITQFTVGIDGNKDKPKSEPSHVGFKIDQEFISEVSKAMTHLEASRIISSFKNSPKIMGRNLYIIMADQDDEINGILEKLSNDVELT